MSIEKVLAEGLVFKKSAASGEKPKPGQKTKARKTSYIKGAHGSGAAKMKAEFRRLRKNRHKR